MTAELIARIDRLESLDEIRQLVSKYGIALDHRDMNALVGLFPEDIQVSKTERGRPALRKWLDETMRVQFDGTSHHVGNHVIEFDDADHAQGIVYSQNEHETGAEWVIMQMMYFDRYERIAGRWFFRRRLPLYWYATDLNKPPIGSRKMRWPGREPYEGGFHDLFPSWKQFWERTGDPDTAVPAPAPIGKFIETMRGSGKAPSVRVR